MLHIRPVYPGGMGVYKTVGYNQAVVIFKGTYDECIEFVRNYKEEECTE